MRELNLERYFLGFSGETTSESRRIWFCGARAPNWRRSVQTYHDWCTCAPICHLMLQLSVQQGHVYEGDNRSGWRRERNLKSSCLFLSSCRCTLHSQLGSHYIRKHIYTQRDACRKGAHAYASSSSTLPHTRHGPSGSRVQYFPPFRISSKIGGETIRGVPARSSAPRGSDRSRSMGWERHPLGRNRVCSFSTKETVQERMAGSRVRSRQLRKAREATDGFSTWRTPTEPETGR